MVQVRRHRHRAEAGVPAVREAVLRRRAGGVGEGRRPAAAGGLHRAHRLRAGPGLAGQPGLPVAHAGCSAFG